MTTITTDPRPEHALEALLHDAAEPDIFSDVMGADMCTDPSCYDNKVQQHHSRRRAQLEAAGHQIIEGDDARALMAHAMCGPEGYARLDNSADSPTTNTLRHELAPLLDKGELVPVMIVNPYKDGDVLACVPEDQVPGLLERAGRKKAAASAKAEREQMSERQAQHDTTKREKALRKEYETTWYVTRTPAARPDGAADTASGVRAETGDAAPELARQAADVGKGEGPQDEGLEASGPKVAKAGDRVRITFYRPPFTGKLGTVIFVHKDKSADVKPDEIDGDYRFESDEFELLEGGEA